MKRRSDAVSLDFFGGLPGLAVAALAGLLALRKLDDFDTWWHLAAGRWIAGHGAIPTRDVLSHTVRDHPWIDLQWGFDLGSYLLHRLGGPALLGVVGALGFTIAIMLTVRLIRPHLEVVPAAALVLVVVLAAQDRYAVRPEMLSSPLLVGILGVLEYGRLHEGRRLWLLVPLMIVWVNVHALFVIGLFAIGCAFFSATALFARKLAPWSAASAAAVLVNPYGFRGALFPLKLLSRIDGSNPVFQTIAEFRSPFAQDAGGVAIAAYKVLLGLGCAAAAAALVRSRRRTTDRSVGAGRPFDWGGLVFFGGLAALSIAARRNAALFAIGGAPFIARCLGAILATVPDSIRRRALSYASLSAAGVVGAAALVGASVVTGAFYKWDGQPREFGVGVLEGSFPVRAAAFAREAKLPPKMYSDVAAGGYLAWDDPLGDGVFIDGRLEVYDTAFFSDYVEAMYDQDRWERDADRFGIQTAIIFHRWENRRLLVERLVHGGIWSLVYADEVAAVFVRARGNDAALARAGAINERFNQATRVWLSQPVAKWPYPAGRVEGTRAFARLLATADDAEGAVEIYTRLLELGIPARDELEVRLLLARRFASTGRLDQAREQSRRILAIDPENAEVLKLLP